MLLLRHVAGALEVRVVCWAAASGSGTEAEMCVAAFLCWCHAALVPRYTAFEPEMHTGVRSHCNKRSLNSAACCIMLLSAK
jgi:hypothetical protein